METIEVMALVFLICCLIALPFAGYQVGINQNIKLNQFTPQKSDLLFLETAREKFIQMHESNITSYNCINYSNDFAELMKGFGYNISLEAGYNKNNTAGHVWNKLSIEFDPQDGSINNSKIYYRDYEESDLKRFGVLK